MLTCAGNFATFSLIIHRANTQTMDVGACKYMVNNKQGRYSRIFCCCVRCGRVVVFNGFVVADFALIYLTCVERSAALIW